MQSLGTLCPNSLRKGVLKQTRFIYTFGYVTYK